ncbi:uncharacterized protein LOC119106439 [Pollicipes pollicipes]|uniref:uncharacterized protein LOC119106439 n=1 Tax=Pollicipes pollicipes TaxID=41117 RepID=UPI001884C648|nr:uncharacterized protein LOC119106439 [Pollicipes pollicipes]
MGLRRLSSCCCCDLQTGVVSIGITFIILNGLGVLFLALILSSENVIRSEIANDPSLFESGKPNEEQIEVILARVKLLFGTLLAMAAASLPFDALLLVAVWKRRHLWMLPWLVWYSLITLLSAAWSLYLVGIFVSTGDYSAEAWVYIVGQLAAAIVFCYLIAVVISYYLHVRDQRNGGRDFSMQPLQTA